MKRIIMVFMAALLMCSFSGCSSESEFHDSVEDTKIVVLSTTKDGPDIIQQVLYNNETQCTYLYTYTYTMKSLEKVCNSISINMALLSKQYTIIPLRTNKM